MHFDNYQSVDEFLMDESFRRWVIEPGHKGVRHIQGWIEAHPEKTELWKAAADIIRIVEMDTIEESSVQAAREWSKIEVVLREADRMDYKTRLVSFTKGYKHVYKYAAAISFLLLVTFLALFLKHKSYDHYVTAYGEKKRLELADGSVLTLNANSSLKVKIDFRNSSREAWLEGEAFFEIDQIERNGGRVPFVVHAGNLNIEVLGTEFNVFNRKEKVQVVLEQGAISINALDSETINVVPGEIVEYDAMEMKRKVVDTELFSSWRDNNWYFKDTPLSSIVLKIEEIYGVSFIIEDDEIGDDKMSGALPASSLDILLNSISRIYGIEVIENENQYIIRKNSSDNN